MHPDPYHSANDISEPGMGRRDFLRAGGAASLGVALSTLLAACGSSGSSGSGRSGGAGGGTTDVLVWYWGEQEAPGMQKFMEHAVKRFNAQQSKIKVTAVLQSSDTLYSAFATAAQAGRGPDIQYLWGGTQALVDVWLGYLSPLTPYIEQSWLDQNIPKAALAQTNWSGKQWGLPFYQIGSALPYNKRIFRKAGLDPDNPPTKWDDFLAALEKIKATGATPFGMGFKDQYLGGWLVSYFGQQNFNSIQQAIAPFKGSATPYSGSLYTEWIEKIQQLIQHGFCNNDVLSINLYQGQNLFPTHKAAIVTSNQPQITSFYRTMGGADTVGVMRAPAFGTGTFANSFGNPVQVLLLTKFSQHKEEAAEFLKFLHTPEMMHMMYKVSGAITPDNRFQPSWLDTETDTTMAHWQKTLPEFWYQYYYPLQFENNGVDPGLQKLWEPGGTVGQAVSTMQSAIKQWQEQSPPQAQAYANWNLLS